MEFFWSVFSCIRKEYGDLLHKSPYSVQIQENTDQKKLRIWTLFTQWGTFFTYSTNSTHHISETKGSLPKYDFHNCFDVCLLQIIGLTLKSVFEKINGLKLVWENYLSPYESEERRTWLPKETILVMDTFKGQDNAEKKESC